MAAVKLKLLNVCKNSKLKSQRSNNMVRGGNVLEVTHVNREKGRNVRVPAVPSAAQCVQGTTHQHGRLRAGNYFQTGSNEATPLLLYLATVTFLYNSKRTTCCLSAETSIFFSTPIIYLVC